MNPQMINDPIASMQREVKTTNLFEGYVLMDEADGTVVYHESCDEDIIKIEGGDKEFSDVIDEVLTHAAVCLADEDDEDEDEDEYDFEESDIEDEE